MGNQILRRCFLCLQMTELTREHVIPQAFGGRTKANIYCRNCNCELGSTIDAELVNTFGNLATLLRIERERGDNQPYEVKDIQQGIRLVHDGKTLFRKNPVVKITKIDGKIEGIDITARSDKELNAIRERIRAKHGVLDPRQTFTEQ